MEVTLHQYSCENNFPDFLNCLFLSFFSRINFFYAMADRHFTVQRNISDIQRDIKIHHMIKSGKIKESVCKFYNKDGKLMLANAKNSYGLNLGQWLRKKTFQLRDLIRHAAKNR